MKKILLLTILTLSIQVCCALENYDTKPLKLNTGIEYTQIKNIKDKNYKDDCYFIDIMNFVEDANYTYVDIVQRWRRIEIIRDNQVCRKYNLWDLCFLKNYQ